MATTLAERMSKFSGSPTSALIAKVAELKRLLELPITSRWPV